MIVVKTLFQPMGAIPAKLNTGQGNSLRVTRSDRHDMMITMFSSHSREAAELNLTVEMLRRIQHVQCVMFLKYE